MSRAGLVVAAPRSGSGKTTLTLGLMRALTRRGVAVAGAKCGPDYIDPAFHAAASGRASVNLDSWAMPKPLLRALAAEAERDADIVICEGLMGLFDGVPGENRRDGIERRHRGALRLAGAARPRRLGPIDDGRRHRQGLHEL